MRTYEKEEVKSANFFLHNTDKQIELIINWRMRTVNKQKAENEDL